MASTESGNSGWMEHTAATFATPSLRKETERPPPLSKVCHHKWDPSSCFINRTVMMQDGDFQLKLESFSQVTIDPLNTETG